MPTAMTNCPGPWGRINTTCGEESGVSVTRMSDLSAVAQRAEAEAISGNRPAGRGVYYRARIHATRWLTRATVLPRCTSNPLAMTFRNGPARKQEDGKHCNLRNNPAP